MTKNDIAKRFSERLAQIMCRKGYYSNRPKGGIDINALASIAGCSYQMARKYALGQVLPDILTIENIADHLSCHPATLLFDEDFSYQTDIKKSSETMVIDKCTLEYILNKSLILLEISNNKKEIISFIIDVIYEASHLHVDQKTLHKIIEMMISSATLLSNNQDVGYAPARA